MTTHRTLRFLPLPATTVFTVLGWGAISLVLTACASTQPSEAPRPPMKETIHAVTTGNQLIRFAAVEPGKLLSTQPLTGLQPDETVVGIDYRVAKGTLYAVGSSSRLYLIDTATGKAAPVGTPFAIPLFGTEFGIDFNPTVDRIRVVSNGGQNMRVHPDTGAVVDGDAATQGLQPDGALAYTESDSNAGKKPALVAAAYTYNKQNEKITTNYAIDAAQGTLVTQGTAETVTPAVSPNSGRLYTVGRLGTAPFERASFDIADVSGRAYAALTAAGAKSSQWVEIDLATGKAHPIGSITGDAVVGIAIEP